MLRGFFTIVSSAAFGVALFLLALVYAPDRIVPLLPEVAGYSDEPVTFGVAPAAAEDIASMAADMTALRAQITEHARQLDDLSARAAEAPTLAVLRSELGDGDGEAAPLVTARLDQLEAALRDLEAELRSVREDLALRGAGDDASGELPLEVAARLDVLEYRIDEMSNTVLADMAYQLARLQDRIVEISRTLPAEDGSPVR